MPSRAPASRDGTTVRGADYQGTYELPADGEDDENSNPAKASGSGAGVTCGRRRVLGGSEQKKQGILPTLFGRENKRQLVARLTPAGIVNLGNTCYLNSVVQVLLNMAGFTADLRDPALERLSQHLPTSGVWASLRTTDDKLRAATLARPTFDSLKPAVEPSELRTAMGRRGSRWRSFAQQDAHEFLVELLEALQSEVLAAEAAATGRRRMPLSETRCPTARNLSGSLMHTWTCSACNLCTRLKEPFSCLSLQLPAYGTVNLQDLVSEYLKEETIDKNCERCSPSSPVQHTAQHHFWRLPRVLVVHIKRFMPLPQPPPQQQQPQLAALPQPPTGQGSVGGAATAARAANETEATAQASALDVPGTPGRDDSAAAREPATAAAGPSAAPQQPAAAACSREPTPPAPYVYAKVHTVVKVTSGLDLARHCDPAAHAHAHLLKGLAPGSRDPCTGDGDDSAAAAAGSWGVQAGGSACAAATAGGNPFVRQVGPMAGGTLDTAGGGSTCPSPSFIQPNTTALQERTVQQNGGTATKDGRRWVRVLMTPNRGRLPAPMSECGTSAVSTGAQADAGDGVPTPHGGVCGVNHVAARPGSLGRLSDHEQERSPLGNGGSAAFAGAALARAGLLSKCVPSAVKGGLGLVGKLLGMSNGAVHGTPKEASNGDDLRSYTEDDGAGAATVSQLEGGARGGGNCNGSDAARGGAADAVVCSERKAPRPMGASAFFGTSATAATERHSGGGKGPLRGDDSGGDGQQGNADAPVRPSKRVCVEGAAAAEALTERRPSEPSCPPGAIVAPWQLEGMSEDEQLQLALRMSMGEVASAMAAGAGPTGAAPDKPAAVPRPGRGEAGPAAGEDTGDGPDVRRATDFKPTREEEEAFISGIVWDYEEGQGGTGQAPGDGVGGGAIDGARPTNSGPGMSGASAGRNDGDESDCSAGQALDRRTAARRRRRRVAKRFPPEDVLPPAESPCRAGPPRQQQPHHAVAHGADCEDDGTTLLSPAAGGGKRSDMPGAGPGAGGQAADVEMAPADEEQDPDLAAALRESRATYEAEELKRAKWNHVLALPDVEGTAAAATAAAGTGCSTPKRGVAAPGVAESPARPLRRRGGAGGHGDDDGDDGGRGAEGMDALVAAAGLETDSRPVEHAAGSGGVTRRRPQSAPQRCGDADGGHGGTNGGDKGPFKFRFDLPESSAAIGAGARAGPSAEGPAGGQGLGFGGPGTRREEPVDLTGGDDEDQDLHRAIMLSLQDATGQDVVMVDAFADAGPPSVVDLAGSGADGDSAIDVEPVPEKPKVLLVSDSDYEEDSGEEEGDKGNSGDGAGAAAAAGASEPATEACDGATPARQETASGETAVSVPLAQLARYRLHGVVRHKGLTPFSGHYVADALVAAPSGTAGQPASAWYEHNDAVVSRVDFDRVREDAEKQGYLFFFVNQPKLAVPSAAAVAAAAAKPLPEDDGGAAGAGAL